MKKKPPNFLLLDGLFLFFYIHLLEKINKSE